jgi:hypothetical protein
LLFRAKHLFVAAMVARSLGQPAPQRGSGAVIELNTVDIRQGSPLRIGSFRLSMP